MLHKSISELRLIHILTEKALSNLLIDLANIVLSFVKNYDIYAVEYIKIWTHLSPDNYTDTDAKLDVSFFQRIVKVYKTEESFNLFVTEQCKNPYFREKQNGCGAKLCFEKLRFEMLCLEKYQVCFLESDFWKKIIKSHPDTSHPDTHIETKKSKVHIDDITSLACQITGMSAEFII